MVEKDPKSNNLTIAIDFGILDLLIGILKICQIYQLLLEYEQM